MSIPTTIPSNRTFGIEVEFVGLQPRAAVEALNAAGVLVQSDVTYNHRNSHTHWKVVTDGSVADRHGRGAGELVSPILSGIEGLQNVVRTVTALNNAGATVNRSCGLHVHIGADGLTVADLANIAVRYATYENVIDSWMPVSRRSSVNQYCASMRYILERSSYDTVPAYIRNMANARNASGLAGIFYSRYQKVNYQALTRQNTVEFRQHSGTCNAEKIVNWIVFLLGFVETSRLGNVENSSTSSIAPVASRTRRSGRVAAGQVGAAMPANLRRVADTIENLTNNPGSNWSPGASITEIREATNLSTATIRAYVSTLRTNYNFSIRLRFGRYRMVRRGSDTNVSVSAGVPAARRRGRPARSTASTASNNMLGDALQTALCATANLSGATPTFDQLFSALNLPMSVRNFFEERVEEFSSNVR